MGAPRSERKPLPRLQREEGDPPYAERFAAKPPGGGCCDQEMSKRTLAASQKVHEEVSKKETRNHCEPCDVQVSLPGRADE